MPRMNSAHWLGRWPRGLSAPTSHCQHAERELLPGLRRRFWPAPGLSLQGTWHCTPDCFEQELRRQFAQAPRARRQPPAPHRIPLGLLMASRGHLSYDDLRTALEAQRASGSGRIGDWLIKLGFATEDQVTAALALQWACPVFSLHDRDPEAAAMLPAHLLETFRILPVHFAAATRTLYVAFSHGVDYSLLAAIEHLLGCLTRPCLVGAAAMEQTLLHARQRRRHAELAFASRMDPAEMARVIRGYVLKLNVSETLLARTGDLLWVRLRSSREHMDVLLATASDHSLSSTLLPAVHRPRLPQPAEPLPAPHTVMSAAEGPPQAP